MFIKEKMETFMAISSSIQETIVLKYYYLYIFIFIKLSQISTFFPKKVPKTQKMKQQKLEETVSELTN